MINLRPKDQVIPILEKLASQQVPEQINFMMLNF